jgi:5-methylcytosine-specific restriction endonuclease McrBC regulatory subunit McrC
MVLDGKWKDFDGTADEADLRQAYAYARIYQTDRAALLYPTWNSQPFRDDLVVADRSRSVRLSIQTLPLSATARAGFAHALIELLS